MKGATKGAIESAPAKAQPEFSGGAPRRDYLVVANETATSDMLGEVARHLQPRPRSGIHPSLQSSSRPARSPSPFFWKTPSVFQFALNFHFHIVCTSDKSIGIGPQEVRMASIAKLKGGTA